MPRSHVRLLRSRSGSRPSFGEASRDLVMSRPSSWTSTVKRVARSTTVAIWLQCAEQRSPFQCRDRPFLDFRWSLADRYCIGDLRAPLPSHVLWMLRRVGRRVRRCCCSSLASTPRDCTNSDL